MSLKRWEGKRIAASVRRAAIEAIDETTAQTANEARESHWWKTGRGQLAEEITTEPARYERATGQVVGKVGATQRRGFYGLFHERRRPFLRPAGDRTFPGLARSIVRRIR